MIPLVELVLTKLTRTVNLSTGILHPSDESMAKLYFKALYKEGEPLIGTEINQWAVLNGWKPKDAKQLGDLAQRIGSGSRVVIKSKNLLKPNIIQLLKDELTKKTK